MNIKQIIERLGDYLQAIRKRWGIMFVVCLVVAGALYLVSLTKQPFYIAKTVFHPEDGAEESSPTSSISALIGGELSGNQGENRFMIGVLKSQYLSEQVVSDSVEFDGKKQLIADLIIQFRPNYVSLPSFINYIFTFSERKYSYRSKIRSAANEIRTSLEVEVAEEGFIELLISSYESDMAYIISERYIYQLNQYYRLRRTEKASRNVKFYTFRADSIQKELISVNRKLARTIDRQRFDVLAESRMQVVELESQQGILSQMYVSLILAREQAMAQLQEDIPVIQVLDRPQPPFRKIQPSRMVYIFIGLFLGGILGIFLIALPLLRTDVNLIVNNFIENLGKTSEESQPTQEPQQET